MSCHESIPKTVEHCLQYSWGSEADTAAFAQRLSRAPQLRDATVELRGDLGAGKTTLVRHLLRALGVAGRIKSPTYALVEPYQASGGWPIFHFDFYRFGDPREWADAGLRDLYAGPGLKLAEWPEQAAGVLPAPDLAICIGVGADERRGVTVQARTARGRALLQMLESTPAT
ncbi:MAG: tRNA (adenosine(37)-N6)-threonylcarbamoyltransferase complex ATPase subunit type 1 TsaE [Burkholderiaceae bacterium]|jgi:tRNA threonylcarbamoyladenosine biosynthesis protein TsaE|nr:tRNA (adenosine(37)-N6)-threonylcarbamoyltransferase complex ATPase subunit type 1 TsaE [Burkholderiaceae bacterium]